METPTKTGLTEPIDPLTPGDKESLGSSIESLGKSVATNSQSIWEKVKNARQSVFLRIVVVALFAEIGYAVLNLSTMPVYLTVERHLSTAAMGLVLASYLLSEAIFKSPMGQLADRIGSRKLMAFGPAISIFTSLLSFLVPHTNGHPSEILAFIALRSLDGVGAAMLWPAAFGMIGEIVPDADRQKAMSILNLCYLIGIALAMPIGGIVDDLFHNSGAGLVLASAIFIVVSLTAFFGVPETKIQKRPDADQDSIGFKELVRSFHTIPAYLILAAVTFIGIGFPMAIIKLFAEDQFNMSEAGFGALVFPAAIAMAVLSVPLSKWGEKIGRTKSVHYGMAMCSIGLIVISAGMFIPSLRLVIILAIGAIPVGLGFLIAIPAWYASVSEIDPHNRASNIGAVMTAQGVGAILGMSLGSWAYGGLIPFGVAHHFGRGFGHYSPFLGCAICVSAGWILSFKILK